MSCNDNAKFVLFVIKEGSFAERSSDVKESYPAITYKREKRNQHVQSKYKLDNKEKEENDM